MLRRHIGGREPSTDIQEHLAVDAVNHIGHLRGPPLRIELAVRGASETANRQIHFFRCTLAGFVAAHQALRRWQHEVIYGLQHVLWVVVLHNESLSRWVRLTTDAVPESGLPEQCLECPDGRISTTAKRHDLHGLQCTHCRPVRVKRTRHSLSPIPLQPFHES